MVTQDQVTVLDYWRVIWRARGWILALTMFAAVVAFGVGRVQPKVYAAKATILTPRDSGTQSLSASLGTLFLGGGRGQSEGGGGILNLPGVSLGIPAMTTTEDMFIVMLNSRTMREKLFAEFARSWGPNVGSMVVSIKTDTQEKGLIALTVEARHPKLAADLANSYFVHLDQMLEQSAENASKRQESFYAAQLERAAKEVQAAEDALLKFQSENRVIPVDVGTKGAVESGAGLRGAIMALEMQRELMRMTLTNQHPQMRELEKQIAELKRQYSKNLFGEAMDLPPESPTAKGPRKEFFVAAAKMTPVQFTFLKLYRNLKIQEAFYTVALQGLQQLKYEGGLSFARTEVLDPAIPPSAYSRPKPLYFAAVATISALITGIFLAFILEYLHRVREQERQSRLRVQARSTRPDDGAESAGAPGWEKARTVEPVGVPPGRA